MPVLACVGPRWLNLKFGLPCVLKVVPGTEKKTVVSLIVWVL
jgi:hypothetical protein